MEDNQIIRSVFTDWLSQARVLIDLVIIAWIVSAFNFWLLGRSLNRWGIRPRVFSGLLTIPLCPFLHSSWGHLESNTLYFLIFGGLILLHDPTDFAVVSWVALLTSGLGIWIFGKTLSTHVGASGVIFGYFGFLLTRGYFDSNLPSILLTALAFFFYSRFLWGLLPLKAKVSWEGHLFGFVGGGLAARDLSGFKEGFKQLGAIYHQISQFFT